MKNMLAGMQVDIYTDILTFNNTQVQKQLPETIWQVQHKKEIELIMLK